MAQTGKPERAKEKRRNQESRRKKSGVSCQRLPPKLREHILVSSLTPDIHVGVDNECLALIMLQNPCQTENCRSARGFVLLQYEYSVSIFMLDGRCRGCWEARDCARNKHRASRGLAFGWMFHFGAIQAFSFHFATAGRQARRAASDKNWHLGMARVTIFVTWERAGMGKVPTLSHGRAPAWGVGVSGAGGASGGDAAGPHPCLPPTGEGEFLFNSCQRLLYMNFRYKTI